MRAALITASVLALAACHIGGAETREAGPAAKRDYPAGAFDSVSLKGSHNVVVQVGPAASVRAEGPANMLEMLEIDVHDGDLRIGSKRGKWSFKGHAQPVTVYVTVPALKAAAIGGSGDMRIDRVEGAEFSAAIGGSGDMEIGSVKVGKANLAVAGSGDMRAAGTAGETSIAVAGSGNIDAGGLESRTASVSAVGSGNISARAMETAEISIVGSGDVSMSGPAKCTISKMGSGDVRCNAG